MFLEIPDKGRILLIVLLVSLLLIGLLSLLRPWELKNYKPEPSMAELKTNAPSEKSIDKSPELKAQKRKNGEPTSKLTPVRSTDEEGMPFKKIIVRGSVVDQGGESVSQAKVFLFPLASPSNFSSYQSQSDERGFFIIKDVPIGDFKLFAQKGNFTSQYVFGSSLGEDVEEVTIIVPTLGRIIGVIHDTSGEPIPKVTIAMFSMEGIDLQRRSARHLQSQKDGTFKVENLDLNTPVKLLFSKRGFLDYEERIDFVAGLATYPLEIVMAESGWIHGRVTDEDGNPVYKAKIYLRAMEKLRLQFSQTDWDGFFKASDLREPLYNVMVLAKGFAPKKLTAIPINSPEFTIVLTRGGTISGSVVFGQSNPSQPFTIEAIPSNPIGIEQHNPDRTRSFHNPENEFTLDRLPPGEYTLKVQGQGWALAYKGPLYVAENAATEEVVIPMEQAIELIGGVYKGDTGESLPSVLVYLVKASGPYTPFLSAVSDNNGTFRFRRIPEGEYLIVAGQGDFRYKSAKFSLEFGTDYDEFSIVLAKNPDIDLPSLIHPPIAGIGVILQRHENVVSIEKAIPQGPAAIGGLQKGDLIIEVDHQPIEGSPLAEIIDRVRGEENSLVVLGIERNGCFLQKEIVRNRIGY